MVEKQIWRFQSNLLKGLWVFGLIALLTHGCNRGGSPEIEAASWSGEPVVQTKYGKVKGLEDEAETWAWKAIPYTKPPVGELRWKAPQDPIPWEGIRETTDFCEICPQYSLNSKIMGSEDCLYLNIWRPQSGEIDLPVYFWIHGGGNSSGTAALKPYFGNNLAKKANMVVVTINYRLGPLGWLTHPALRSGKPGDAFNDSGNYGTLDIIKALEWVKENIKAFGGNSENVTIAGESAGGRNVLILLISPSAKGIFHRAIVQSGRPNTTPMEDGEASTLELLQRLLMNDGTATDEAAAKASLEDMSNAEIASYLRSKTSQEILACCSLGAFGLLDGFLFNYADGAVIPEKGFKTFVDGTYPNKVPIILGTNKEEMKLFMFADPYFKDEDDLYQAAASYLSDMWKVDGVDDIARKISSHADQPHVYAYQFLWGAGGDKGKSVIPNPWGFKIGSSHILEIPFFFANEKLIGAMTQMIFTEKNRPGRIALSAAMVTYLAQFVRTGNPNQSDSKLPEWSHWTNEEGGSKCFLLDADYEHAIIKMSSEEITEEKVRAGLDQLEDRLRIKLKEYLAGHR